MWKLLWVGGRRKGEGMNLAQLKGESTLSFAWDWHLCTSSLWKTASISIQGPGVAMTKETFANDSMSYFIGISEKHTFLLTLSVIFWLLLFSAQWCPTFCESDCPWSKWARLFCFCPWNSLDKNTGAGCHSLLQGIFPTQGSNPGLSHCRWILYHLSHQKSP